MTTYPFNLIKIDSSWRDCVQVGLSQLDPSYLAELSRTQDWLPGSENIFNAFTLPLSCVNYVLLGESPYPRQQSANGYAFWDAAVEEIWSPKGLSRKVNRATSLRNIVKMLLIAEGLLNKKEVGQETIAKIDKTALIATNNELFSHLLNHGFLLLNASLVLQNKSPRYDAKAWMPFIFTVLDCLIRKKPTIRLLLLGRIAQYLKPFLRDHPRVMTLCAEHPYNLSFINNHQVIEFFRPLHLLRKIA